MRDTEVDTRSRSADAEMNIGTGPKSVISPRVTWSLHWRWRLKVPPQFRCTTITLHGITSQQTLIICRHLVIRMTVRMCISVSMALYI